MKKVKSSSPTISFSKRDPQEMWIELRAVVNSIGNPHCEPCSTPCWTTKTSAALRLAPAAKQITTPSWRPHRARAFVVRLGSHQPRALPGDLDLLLAGVVLHDIGRFTS